mgnify:CR=1 FL=1
MKRVLFALPLMVMASSAFAAGLTVTNHSGLPIDELTVSASGANASVTTGMAVTDNTGLTMANSVLGTPMYMAPEQFRGGEALSPAADVFALGAMLFEILVGQPLHGDTSSALQIEADVAGLEGDPRMSRVIRGQVAVATTPGKVRRVRLLPGDPPATRQAVDAIMGAELVVLGPGSWFTSVIPHVLVPGLAAALQSTPARRALVLNLDAEPGETAGFSAERHLHVLAQHAPGFTVHDIIVDAARVPSERERDQLRRTATLLDASVMFSDVSRPGTPLHDPAKLAAALESVRVPHTRKTETATGETTVTTTIPAAAPAPGRATGSGPRGDDPWR